MRHRALALSVGAMLLVGACRGGSQSPVQKHRPVTADDLLAQQILEAAHGVALEYFSRHHTFTGFGPRAAEALHPSLLWRGDAGASRDNISINHARDNTLLMSTASRTGSWDYCIGIEGDHTYYGTRDAAGLDDPKLCGDLKAWPGG